MQVPVFFLASVRSRTAEERGAAASRPVPRTRTAPRSHRDPARVDTAEWPEGLPGSRSRVSPGPAAARSGPTRREQLGLRTLGETVRVLAGKYSRRPPGSLVQFGVSRTWSLPREQVKVRDLSQ